MSKNSAAWYNDLFPSVSKMVVDANGNGSAYMSKVKFLPYDIILEGWAHHL